MRKISTSFKPKKCQMATDTWFFTTWIGCIEHSRTRSYSSFGKEIESQRDLDTGSLLYCHCHHDPIKSNRPYVLSAKQAVGGFVGNLMGIAGRGRAIGEGAGDLVGALAGSNKHQDQ
jgi:outer membrane lipoprotein SlyB